MSITLLLNSNMSGQSFFRPLAKIRNFIEINQILSDYKQNFCFPYYQSYGFPEEVYL